MSIRKESVGWSAMTLVEHANAAALRWREALGRRVVAARTASELASLSDGELKDIGIFRQEIGRVAREAADRMTPSRGARR